MKRFLFFILVVLTLDLPLSLGQPLTGNGPLPDPHDNKSVAKATGQHTADVSAETKGHTQSVVHEGISVQFAIIPADPHRQENNDRVEGQLVQGDDVTVRFKITDTTTGSAVTTLEPAAWLHPAHGDATCQQKVKSFLTGSLGNRAEMDLNVFYVLALNEDASISVVDPLFSYGGSKLLDKVRLRSPGQDWLLTRDESRLFVTMPDMRQVAAVDTATWDVVKNIDTSARPMRIGSQPDGKYVWVGHDGANDADPTSGVTVIDVDTLEVVDRIPTGAGHHEIAFTDDSRYAFVTNKAAGTLSIIDIRTLKIVKTIDTGPRPSCVAFSKLSQAVYTVNEEDGSIVVIDCRSLEVIKRIEAEPGLRTVSFAPNGRLGFAINTRESLVHIIDASTHRIVQTGGVGKNPDQITFTESLAYVRSLGTEQIYMIPLDQVGKQDAPLPVIDFTGGHHTFGEAPFPSIAAGIVPAPGGLATLVANPVDEAIYYYREGMAAPMGEFQNYGHQPRAVLVVDRSLREVEPGVYATDIKLDLSGKVDVPFFLDSPRIVHCFGIDVKPNPKSPTKDKQRPLTVRLLGQEGEIRAGQTTTLRFKVSDPQTGQPKIGLKDFGVLTYATAGWHNRQWARATAQPGVYEIDFTPPKPGAYYVSFQCPSLNARYNQLRPATLQVAEKG